MWLVENTVVSPLGGLLESGLTLKGRLLEKVVFQNQAVLAPLVRLAGAGGHQQP